MKKTYLYFILPVVLTALFGVYYGSYSSQYKEKVRVAEEKQRMDREEKRKKEALAREQALKEATAATEKRRQEKAEKEARDAKEKEARQLAIQVRDKTVEDSRRLADKAKQLAKEVEETKSTIASLQRDHEVLVKEKAHLEEYLPKANANVQSIMAAIEKIQAADQARIQAEKAAAAAAKK